MLTGRLRRKLSRIARGLDAEAAPAQSAPADAAPSGEAMPNPSRTPLAIDYDPRECGAPVETQLGACWRVTPSLAALLPDYAERVARLAGSSEEALFLDIETCGLTTTAPLFLIGLVTVSEDGLALTQLLARDYTEEAAVLHAFAAIAATRPAWVSFNGASFDVPYLRDRAGFHRLTLPDPARHEDVLHPARRAWRRTAPNCRLTTLEEHICGWRRHGDIPGELIPGVYHDFVRDGNWAPLAPVLHHNALDLLTLAELWRRLRG